MSKDTTLELSTIETVLDELRTSNTPVIRALHTGNGFKVLVLGLNSGMVLAEHKAKLPSKLTVLSGCIAYRTETDYTPLFANDEINIPVGEIHAIVANRKSICLLTQG